MSFLSKVELKKQLKDLGIKVEGNYVRKSEIKKILGKEKSKYVVNVGNIGNIDCESKEDALKTYNEYVQQSKSGYGRASGESVILLEDGEPIKEYFGTNEADSE